MLYLPSADRFVWLSPFKKKSLEFQLQELQPFNLMPYKILCSEVNKMRLIRRYYMLCSFLHSFQAKSIEGSTVWGGKLTLLATYGAELPSSGGKDNTINTPAELKKTLVYTNFLVSTEEMAQQEVA